MGSWYLLGVLFKISNKYSVSSSFLAGSPPWATHKLKGQLALNGSQKDN